MKIGTLAERLGVTTRTLRFYEEHGLVHPRRSSGGTRCYDETDQARFAALLALVRLGFSLEDLARLTGIRQASHTGDEASRQAVSQLQSMDADLQALAKRIDRQRADIKRAQAFLQQCHGCRRKPTRKVCDQCEISAAREGITTMRVIWDEHRNT
jgi:DNA-binding transcriptional MerR regulator